MLIIGAILAEVSKLKPHEDINKNYIFKIKESIINEGIKFPIIADKDSNIILDGHHRFNIFKELKIGIIPVFYVDYFDEKIIVDSWNGKNVTKQDVIKSANSGKIFPSKTTKHLFVSKKGIVHISSIVPRINIDIYKLVNLMEG